MIFINIIAAAAILISIAERLSWARHSYKQIKDRTDEDREILRSPEYKENTSSYYYILSAFIIIFTICLILAEFRHKWTRRTMAVLDTKFGRGFFIIFIGLMIPQNKNGVAIAMSVIANFIGLINLCVGYNQGSDAVIQNAKLPAPILAKDEQSPIGTEIALTTKGGSQPNKVDQEPSNS